MRLVTLLDRFYNKYIIKGTLLAETPIHIGASGESFDPVQVDNSIIRDSNGKPYIPGSSLKGVLRSCLETLLSSGIDERFNACLIVNDPCLGKKEQLDEIKNIQESVKAKQDADRIIAEEIYKRLCTVCKIFGNPYFASKLTVNDCLLKGDAHLSIRDGVGIDRDTGTAADKKKYDFEQVDAGARFEFYMAVDNLEPEYEDILKLILNVLESGQLRVGGKTSVGLGRVRLIETRVYKIEQHNLKSYLMQGLKEEMRWQYV
ncbi:CRISPR-associated RAMP protein [Caldicoprobacter algeriensis]|nr:CRISPR-associated RAMP protein Csx7 [Caldicoprobacter algeriensis]MCM8901253.1 CRISPR-associated RAMP protein [Caldicoprobacter algeriensis]